jgi:hypothetical protein
MVLKLTKKPVEVEGVRWTGKNVDEMKDFVGSKLEVERCRCRKEDNCGHKPKLFIKTLEGRMKVVAKAVVVKGVEGEFYPVDPEIFPQTFDCPADEPATEGISEDLEGNDVVWVEDDSIVDAPFSVDVVPYLLNHLSEEASEVGKAACKAGRFGLRSPDPRNGMSGVDKIVEEANDVLGVIVILNEELKSRGATPIEGVGDPELVQKSIDKRLQNLQKEYELGRFTLPAPAPEDA